MIERLKEMYAISSEGVAGPNEITDFPITTGHTNTVSIVRWKESLNDIWADRGEKINKRYFEEIPTDYSITSGGMKLYVISWFSTKRLENARTPIKFFRTERSSLKIKMSHFLLHKWSSHKKYLSWQSHILKIIILQDENQVNHIDDTLNELLKTVASLEGRDVETFEKIKGGANAVNS